MQPVRPVPVSAQEHRSSLLAAPGPVSFLQTPDWADVKADWTPHRLRWSDGSGTALVLARGVPGPRGLPVPPWTFHYCPEGPVLDWTRPGAALQRLDGLAAAARDAGAFALRVGPPSVHRRWDAATVKAGLADARVARLDDLPPDVVETAAAELVDGMRARGWQDRTAEDGFGLGQPHVLAQVPLRGNDEASLLAGMNQGWRRNLRRADAAGVVCAREGPGSLAEFHRTYVETAVRDGFRPRPVGYFETLLGALDGRGSARAHLLTARRGDGSLLAAALVLVVGATWTYLYGASSTAHRDERGANAVQWFALRQALQAGAEVYDLRGVTPTLDPDDPHAGLLRFKVSAGAQVVQTVGEWELGLRPAVHSGFRTYLAARSLRHRVARR